MTVWTWLTQRWRAPQPLLYQQWLIALKKHEKPKSENSNPLSRLRRFVVRLEAETHAETASRHARSSVKRMAS